MADKQIVKAKNQYGLLLSIGDIHFSGLNTLEFSDINIVPIGKDTLFSVDRGEISIRLLPLLLGHLKLSKISLINPYLQVTQKNGVRNFDFLFKKQNISEVEKTEIDLAAFANRLINQVLYKIPSTLNIKNFEIKVLDDSLRFNLISNTIIENHQLISNIELKEEKTFWTMKGNIFPDNQQLNVKLYGNNGPVVLPYLYQKFNLKFSFDTLWTRMDNIDRDADQLKINGAWGIKNMHMQHPKISLNEIYLKNGSIDCNMIIGKNYVSIDSSSKIYLKNVSTNPYLKVTLKPEKIYELGLKTGQIPSTDFLNCFPDGLFESLEGIKSTGTLQYSLDFKLEDKNPDSLIFNSTLKKENFKIISFGKENLQKLNESFVYVPYENGRPVRPFVIGPVNPNYFPIDQISPYVKSALMSSEDGSFFWHKGFNEEAFKKSIATNYKEKKFKRGGSTISMQLVKNVFLRRNKTISRKLEEALIVWLIENNNLVSKNRMYEVYLNLIEWGPNVYGIGEASRFYFSKLPSQLSPGEGMFLANIVPKPKLFKYSFNPDGTLKPFVKGYFDLLSGILMRRGELSAQDTVNIFESVKLKGPALELLESSKLSKSL